MTIEEFVSTEHNGSGAARGCGYTTIRDDDCFGYGYDCYTIYDSGDGGSIAERKSCGSGEANGRGANNRFGVGHGGCQTIKY